jgi:AcrR family transcriptional regulator
MENPTKSRTMKKRDKTHQDILTVAAELISAKGSLSVSLEEISSQADVARKTIYNHFENKEALINELFTPLCTHARDYLNRFDQEQALTLDHIWDYCLELWEQEDYHAMVLYQVSPEDYPNFLIMIAIFVQKLMERIPECSSRSDEERTQAANCIYLTYLPLLQVLEERKNYQKAFRLAMTGLTRGVLLTD